MGTWLQTGSANRYYKLAYKELGSAAWNYYSESITNLFNKVWRDNVINVKSDYSAVGDGVTDDSVAIQNSATAAAGKTLFIPNGTYVSDQIVLSNNTTVIFDNLAIIKAKANMTAENAVFSTGGSDKHGIRILFPKIDGNKANQINTVYAISIGDDSYDCQILGGEIYDINGPSIALSGYDHLVREMRIHGGNGNGIQAVATDSHDTYKISIVGCWIWDIGTGGGGIEFDEGVHDSLIDRNFVWDTTEQGIQNENGSFGNTISDNFVWWTSTATVGQSGILIGYDSTTRTPTLSTKNVIIKGNRTRNCYIGIHANTASLLTISENEAFENESDGFRISTVDNSIVSGNRAINNGQSVANRYGILITTVNRSTIQGNFAYDTEAGGSRTQDFGIYELGASDNNTISGNVAYNNITGQMARTGANTQIALNIGYDYGFWEEDAYSKNIVPDADDTYRLGVVVNPFTAYKSLTLMDTTDGKHYKIETINGVLTATALD